MTRKYTYGWTDPRGMSPWGLRWHHWWHTWIKAALLYVTLVGAMSLLWELMT